LSECLVSPSVEYLRTTGRIEDLEFILQHDDDVRAVFPLEEGEVKMLPLPGD
jgi:hypothetical protein